MRIYLVNVGANASHGRLFSPFFEDGTFEFLPIPEGGKPRRAVRYRDLRSYNNPEDDLLRFVPEDKWRAACHNDPDFDAFTYGDDGTNPRSSALKRLREGDILLFLARLELCKDGKRTGHAGFYLVGGLVVEFAGFVSPRSKDRKRFGNNAHARRGDAEFLGVAGSERSRRFKYAVPITRQICDRVFRAKDGNRWAWGRAKSELTTIGSYTRTSRCMLDIAKTEEARRAATLRTWIAKYTGESDAEVLRPPRLYSYTVASDSGFAPNPFHGICTLACCKPAVRRTAQKGDYVVGLGPTSSCSRVVYAMRVTETLEFDDYWRDRRFEVKKPNTRAGGVEALGDNVYYRGRQMLPSQHNRGDIPRDTNGKRVLIGGDFIYWGSKGPELPPNLEDLILGRQGHKSTANDKHVPAFINWFESQDQRGRLRMPTKGLPSASRTRKRC